MKMERIRNKSLAKIMALILVLVMMAGTITGCGDTASAAETGRLVVKVNPEVAVDYDEEGNVTGIEGINNDGRELIADHTGYEGKTSGEVIRELVAMMDKEGYLKKGNKGRKITIEVEDGSHMPSDDFLQNIVKSLKKQMSNKKYTGKIVIEGESNYGMSNYSVSPYGNSSYEKKTIKKSNAGNNGNTDYYGDSDYNGTSDGNTNYDSNSNYGGGNSNYDSNSDYGGGNSDYGSSDYGDSGYGGDSGYDD